MKCGEGKLSEKEKIKSPKGHISFLLYFLYHGICENFYLDSLEMKSEQKKIQKLLRAKFYL